MIGFGESYLVWIASTLIPAFTGLLVITWLGKKVPVTYVVAFALGIFLWFFVDTISGSSFLDVNSGFSGDWAQLGVVLLFLVGVLIFFSIDRKRNMLSPVTAVGKYGMAIPILTAVAVGIHGIGEGTAYGHLSSVTDSTTIIDAFGGLTAGVAYVLHKGLEPMMIGACYAFYLGQEKRSTSRMIRDVLFLSVIFTIPSLLGAATGYFIVYDTTYFFALGTGTSIYAAFRLAGPLFANDRKVPAKDTILVAIAWILGFMAIYVAALFHS
jgi:hypothetical protein